METLILPGGASSGGGGGSVGTLDDLLDVDVSTIAPKVKQGIEWDGTLWKAGDGRSVAPNELFVSDYGAVGDAVMGNTGQITAGSDIFDDLNANFTNALNKVMFVNGIGSGNGNYRATIIEVQSPTRVRLSVAATVGKTGANYATYCYGTDDTAAWQNAVDAAATVALLYGRSLIHADPVVYMLSTSPTVAANGQNAMIKWPFVNADGASWIEILGVRGGANQHWLSKNRLNRPSGTTFFCGMTGRTYNGANGIESIFGGPAAYKNFARSYHHISLRNIRIIQGDDPQITAVDSSWLMSCWYENVQVGTLASAAVTPAGFASQPPLPTNPQAFGIILPSVNSWNPCALRQVGVSGHFALYGVGELADGISVHGAWGRVMFALFSAYYPNHFTKVVDVNTLYGIASIDPSAAPASAVVAPTEAVSWDNGSGTDPVISASPIVINNWDIQHAVSGFSPAFARVWDLHDPNAKVWGEVWAAASREGTGGVQNILKKNGGANFRMNDLNLKPGVVPAGTAPTMPASTGSFTNPYQRPLFTQIKAAAGETITSAIIAGVTFNYGVQTVQMMIPAGRGVVLTYTGATPTATFMLM